MSTPPRRRVSPAPAAVDRTIPLSAGTRVVQNLIAPCSCCEAHVTAANRRPRQFGTVMPHDEQYSQGMFPVRWDSGIWGALLDVSYVTAVSPEEEAALRASKNVTVFQRAAS